MGNKISIIGCGNIGSTLAGFLFRDSLFSRMALVDKYKDRTCGRMIDLIQAMNIENKECQIVATDDYSEIAGSDLVVVTAGVPRTPGMTRNDLLKINILVIRDLGREIKNHCPDAFVIVVTNPMDNMAWAMHKSSGLSHKKVVGMGGILDSARFRFYIKEKLKEQSIDCHYKDIEATVIGSHNDTMIPMVSSAKVMGESLRDFAKNRSLPANFVDQITASTAGGGAAVVKLLGTGSAYVAPAMSILKMIQAFLNDDDTPMPCSVYMEEMDMYIGLPVRIGREGLKEICTVPWTEDEKEKFDKSVASNKESVLECERILNELA